MYLQLCCILSFVARCLAIWPAPQSFEKGKSVVWLAPDFYVSYNDGNLCQSPQICQPSEQRLTLQTAAGIAYDPATGSSTFTSSNIVYNAVVRARKLLFEQNITPWKRIPRNTLSSYEPISNDTKVHIDRLDIVQTKPDDGSTFRPLDGEVDESYTLIISVDGEAKITAVSSTGVLHALNTFTQLFHKHSSGVGVYTKLAPLKISDAPKFSHRGLNMDVARNWYPVESILKAIDALAWNKFNRLHIHMTDSQSWPLDIPSIPELSRKGAYQAGLSYSPTDLEKIQRYGTERGVAVYIEFDMPGHTTSIGHAFPELIAAMNAKPWTTYCAEPPCGSLKLNSSNVYDFLDTLWDDVLPRVTPYSSYFHTGGDEVNVNTYLLDDTVHSNSTAILQSLIQKFVDFNHAKLLSHNLTPIVWEEMLLTWNLTLHPSTIIQTWLSSTSVQSVVARGHKALVGSYDYWYLDCGAGQWLNFDNGESYEKWFPFEDYCSPVKNWRLAYSLDPLAGIEDGKRHLVLGGEAHVWSEQTDEVNFDGVVWPRASAVGEVLWSGRQDNTGRNRSQLDAAPRLAEWRERMVARGVRAGPVQMVYCTQGNATDCAI